MTNLTENVKKLLSDLTKAELAVVGVAAFIGFIITACILYAYRDVVKLGIFIVTIAFLLKKYKKHCLKEQQKQYKSSLQITLRDTLFEGLHQSLGNLLDADKPMGPEELTAFQKTFSIEGARTIYRYSFCKLPGSRQVSLSQMKDIFNDYLKNYFRLHPLGYGNSYKDVPVLYVQDVRPDYVNTDYYTIEISYVDNDAEYEWVRSVSLQNKPPATPMPRVCDDPDFGVPPTRIDKDFPNKYDDFDWAPFNSLYQKSPVKKGNP